MSDELKDLQKKDNMIDSIIEETRYLSEKEKMEMEALKLNKVKRNRATAGAEEIYSNTTKEVRYTNQNPLDIEDDEDEVETAEKPEEEKPEEEIQEEKEPEVAVTLTPEYEEGTKISEDIVENVENFDVKPIPIQDIDTIDIDIDSEPEAEKPDEAASEKTEENEEKPEKEESEFEKLFGKAKPVSSAQTIVSRVPVYQHESKVIKST